MREVRKERTSWRDEALSRRHRLWGWDCPAVDIDFLMLEYDGGKATALVEYKNEFAAPQYASHPSYRALIDLGDRAQVPVFACRYSADFTKWHVTPLNYYATEFCPARTTLTENQWVALLYKTRGYGGVPAEVLEKLKQNAGGHNE